MIFCSVSLRVIIFATLGDDLQHRVELSNVFNGLRGIKEAAALIRHRLSPYSGTWASLALITVTVYLNHRTIRSGNLLQVPESELRRWQF